MGVAGKTYPPVVTRLEPEPVAAFARSIGADPAGGVPPTFAAVYALAATASQLFADPEAAVDFARLLHAEQEFEWERHPEVGEEVTATGTVTADIERRGARFLTLVSDCLDADGRGLCRSRALFVVRGPDA